MEDASIQQAHRKFAVEAFNSCWELIDLPSRTPEQDREMIRRSEASFWHWQHRTDRTPKDDSVGYWQLARVHALAGDETTAIDYATSALDVARSNNLAPFYIGYALEALARAHAVAKRFDECQGCLAKARAHAGQVTEAKDRALLIADLDTIPTR